MPKPSYFEEQERLRARRVIYTGDVSEDQIRWGGHADPRGRLVVGREYTVEMEEVHSWHTKLYLVDTKNEGFGGKSFNTLWFVDVT